MCGGYSVLRLPLVPASRGQMGSSRTVYAQVAGFQCNDRRGSRSCTYAAVIRRDAISLPGRLMSKYSFHVLADDDVHLKEETHTDIVIW